MNTKVNGKCVKKMTGQWVGGKSVFGSLNMVLLKGWKHAKKQGNEQVNARTSDHQPFDRAFIECKSLARLGSWYENFIASGHQMSPAELGFFIDRVSALRAAEDWGRGELAVMTHAAGFVEFFFGPNHPDFREIRAKQLELAQPRPLEVPRRAVWTLGSTLWCMRTSIRSVGTSSSSHVLKLLEHSGPLIRESLRDDEPTEPLISAFTQGLVAGYYGIKKVDISWELERSNFWRPCELSSIHDVGLELGRHISTHVDSNANGRGEMAVDKVDIDSDHRQMAVARLSVLRAWPWVAAGCAVAGGLLFLALS